MGRPHEGMGGGNLMKILFVKTATRKTTRGDKLFQTKKRAQNIPTEMASDFCSYIFHGVSDSIISLTGTDIEFIDSTAG
jgi:hypothetical protein